MAEAKPFASLSSGLLARKGQARPAMRSQAGGADDLGWNDLGQGPRVIDFEQPRPYPPAVPEVVRQQEEIARELDAEPKPSAKVALTPGRAGSTAAPRSLVQAAAEAVARVREKAAPGKRTAFTLRLDAERQLKLRLAAALSNQSAQQLVCKMIDDFLKTVPDLDTAAAALPGAEAGGQR